MSGMRTTMAKISFAFARETKNTYRFEEEAASGFEQIGVIYIKKTALGPTPPPRIIITVEVAK
jgi:hypothetical protein